MLVAGDRHPNGKHYRWHHRGDLTALPYLPAVLFAQLCYATPSKTARTAQHYNPQQVNALLDVLNPTDFSDYHDWLKLLFSCHHATGGDSEMLAFFVTWSLQDPAYGGDGEKIEQKWHTVNNDKDEAATVEHLMQLAKKANFNAASYLLPAMEGFTVVESSESQALVPAKKEPEMSVIPYTDKDTSLNNSFFLSQNYPGTFLMDSKEDCHYFDPVKNHWTMLPWELLKTRYQRQLESFSIKQNTIESGLKGLYKHIKQVNLVNPSYVTYAHPEFFISPIKTSAIPLKNGLFLPEAYVNNQKYFVSHCSNVFCRGSGSFDFDALATCPTWLAFLNSLWNHDTVLITQLQQWMGYCLLKTNELQKLAVFVGAPRGGKSLIMRTLQACVTPGLSCTISIDKPSEPFGLAGIVNKYIIVIPEARSLDSRKSSRVVDVLKTISGGDTIDISQKYLSDIIIEASQKINIVCNEFPNLFDHSGALVTRFIVFPFTKSFLGKEDVGLRKKLHKELSGIFNWMCQGLKNLLNRRTFTEAPSSLLHKNLLQNWTQPLKAFFDDCCELNSESIETKDNLYNAYTAWSFNNGLTRVKSRKSFSYSMTTYFPQLDFNAARRENGKVIRCVKGLALKKEEG